MAKRAKDLKPNKGAKDFIARAREMQMKFKTPDRKDYQRTIAGRGDTHALDGGKISPLQTKKGKAFMEARKNFLPTLPVWEDRNRANIGTKLNK